MASADLLSRLVRISRGSTVRRTIQINVDALRSFLVPEAQLETAMKATSRRNFFGDWMPNNAKWLYAFVGEYPWATACNVETDDWLGFATRVQGSNLEFVPVFNEVVCEWEYDGTLPLSIYFHVPSRAFFKAGPLRWDSVDGFSTPDGKTVFRDPSASEGGPPHFAGGLG